jgi:hypothetical protein
MPRKIIQLSAAPRGALAKLTLPAQDAKGMKKLAGACEEFVFVRVSSGVSALEWWVNLFKKHGRLPEEDNLRHFIRMVEANLRGTCDFDCQPPGRDLSTRWLHTNPVNQLFRFLCFLRLHNRQLLMNA